MRMVSKRVPLTIRLATTPPACYQSSFSPCHACVALPGRKEAGYVCLQCSQIIAMVTLRWLGNVVDNVPERNFAGTSQTTHTRK